MELEINKAKTEEATLKDALLKMQAMNEGLGQDKVELNKIIMQVTYPHPTHTASYLSFIKEGVCMCKSRESKIYMQEWKITLDESIENVLYQEDAECVENRIYIWILL